MPAMKLFMKVSLMYMNTISNILLFLPFIVPTFQTINNTTLFHADIREMSYDITKVSKILKAILPFAPIASNSSSKYSCDNLHPSVQYRSATGLQG